ncbi:MAG: hypothetical protein ACYC7D_07850 [Nitrososphaerales archaeon]
MKGEDSNPSRSTGTTLKVYRLLYREGKPLGLFEVQKKASLSSPSVARYHLDKLLNQGLVSEKDGGFVVERTVFENMIRIRRSLIPLQTTFVIFFGTTLVGLFLIFRPATISSLFVAAVAINLAALGIFLYQTFDTITQWRT